MEELLEKINCLNTDCRSDSIIFIEEDCDGINQFMCELCGNEQSELDWNFREIVVGKIQEVVEMKGVLKKCQVQVDPEDDGDNYLQIVTNAKHVASGDIVVVAKIGAIVPVGAATEEDGGDGMVVKKVSVGGASSEGVLCDGVMLNWNGGSKGILVKLKGEFEIGSSPPFNKPKGEE